MVSGGKRWIVLNGLPPPLSVWRALSPASWRRLGLDAKAENGGARFFGTFEDAFRANLHARCADRILLVMGRFEARSFEAFSRACAPLPWEDFIGERTAFR